MNICINCKHHLLYSTKHNYYCKIHLCTKASLGINPVTGVSKEFDFCENINTDGNCKLYEEKDSKN